MKVLPLQKYSLKDQVKWLTAVIDMAKTCRAGVLVVETKDRRIEVVNLAGDRLALIGMLVFAQDHILHLPDIEE
jgi:hypothetical protein